MLRRDWRQTLGNSFLAMGLLLLAGVGGAWGWQQWQGVALRDRLRAGPTLPVVALPPAEATPATKLAAGSSSGPTAPPAALRPAEALAAPPRGTAVPPAVAPPALARSFARPATPPARVAGPVGRLTAGSSAQLALASGAKPSATLPAPPEPAATASPTPAQLPAAVPPTPTQARAPAAAPPTKPVRLVIPDLNIDGPVTDMTWSVEDTASGPQSVWQVPEYSAGHAVDTALLGQQGNVVISGHNNIYGRVFMGISQAWPYSGYENVDANVDKSDILVGHEIQVYGADGRRFDYVITAFYRVLDSGIPLGERLTNAKFMDPTDYAQLTLTTCWPPWSNTHRLIVLAQPIGQPQHAGQ
jgi:sortase A